MILLLISLLFFAPANAQLYIEQQNRAILNPTAGAIKHNAMSSGSRYASTVVNGYSSQSIYVVNYYSTTLTSGGPFDRSDPHADNDGPTDRTDPHPEENGGDGPPDRSDPHPNPIGDVPLALMTLLTAWYLWKKNRYKQKNEF